MRRGSWLELRLERRIVPFNVPSTPFSRWLPNLRSPVKRTSVQAIRRLVDYVVDDPVVKGVVVHVQQFQAGWATVAGLYRELQRLKDANKRVVVWLPEGGGNRELYLCSAASEVWISPQAGFGPIGLVATVQYLRPVLDKLGIELHVEARHEFKTAMEPYVRDSMSSSQREQTGALLDTIDHRLRDALANRGADADAVMAAGMLSGKMAVDAKLADGLCYEDELAPKFLEGRKSTFADAFQRLRMYQSVWWRPVRRPKYVAVLDVRGTIVQSRGSRPSRGLVDAESMARKLRRIRKDKRAIGAVLAITSPGGSALASDLIHREVATLAKEKPVVAWFGDVAASGGYYIAAPASSIVAESTTITGSIGVIMARPVVESALNKIGIVTERVRRSPHGDMLSSSRPLDAAEVEILQREADSYYESFVKVVASGRKRTYDEVEPLARGRVWSGADAESKGLVDVLGGLEVAIAQVRTQHGAAADDLSIPGLVVPTPRERIAAPWPEESKAQVQSLLADALGLHELVALAQGREHHWYIAPGLPTIE